MNSKQMTAMVNVLAEVSAERQRQHAMRGEQDLDDGREHWDVPSFCALYRDAVNMQVVEPMWSEVLFEEVGEAILAHDTDALRAELIQVAAVAVQWVEAIDRAKPRQTHQAAPGATKGATVGAGEGGSSWDATGSPVEGGG